METGAKMIVVDFLNTLNIQFDNGKSNNIMLK